MEGREPWESLPAARRGRLLFLLGRLLQQEVEDSGQGEEVEDDGVALETHTGADGFGLSIGAASE